MGDDDRLGDAEAFRRAPKHVRLALGRCGGAPGDAVAPAVPGAIDAEDAKALRPQSFAERDAHVGAIARGAVQEQRHAALLAFSRLIDDMNGAATDLDALPERRKSPFDAPAGDGGEDPQGAQEGGENRQNR